MESNLIRRAIDDYHELLAGEYLSSTKQILEEGTHRRKLSFSGRPTCTVLRPYFIDEASYAYVRDSSNLVMRGITLLRRRLMSDSELRKELDLSPEEEEVIRIGEGEWNPDVSGRLDGFLTTDRQYHFVE